MTDDTASEELEIRLKKLRIRSWRRGTKEMDLLLGPFSDSREGLAALSLEQMDAYEALMDEGDNDLYLWVSGATETPEAHRPIVEVVQSFHKIG
ncbi:MAG: succinate dehydrogenase assembly factor 2 [Pseudomonadota bacterium]